MNDNFSEEEITEQLQSLLHEKGKNALELARKMVLEEEIESKEIKSALKYFMTDCWCDFTRPALLSLICEAVGGDPNITTSVAVSITLISGAMSIHDDIIDQTKNKGPCPTVLGRFGQDIALLVGDALLFKGFTMLYKAVEEGVPAEKIATISDIIKRMFFELGDAEALTLQFRRRTDVTPEEYLRVVRKRSADIEACARISAILCDGSEEEIAVLGEYGRLLGMLAILRNDMIDMLDLDEIIHRIKEEYLPLAILYALQNPQMKCFISDLLKKITTQKDARELSKLVDKAGGFNQIHNCMEELARNAYEKLQKVEYNKSHLQLIIRGMILLDWENFLFRRRGPAPDISYG